LAWELTPAAKACPGYRVSRDLYLARNTGTVADAPAPHGTFVHIDAQSLAGLAVPPDVGASIGNLATLPSDAPFWGLAVSGRVVAICETMVRYGSVVTVQQVYTATDERRQNHARSLITQLLGHPAVAGTPRWRVPRSPGSSRRRTARPSPLPRASASSSSGSSAAWSPSEDHLRWARHGPG
jgi:hypothetical protein